MTFVLKYQEFNLVSMGQLQVPGQKGAGLADAAQSISLCSSRRDQHSKGILVPWTSKGDPILQAGSEARGTGVL